MGADRGLETRAGLFPADFEQRPSEAVNGFAQPGIECGNEAVMQGAAREVLALEGFEFEHRSYLGVGVRVEG